MASSQGPGDAGDNAVDFQVAVAPVSDRVGDLVEEQAGALPLARAGGPPHPGAHVHGLPLALRLPPAPPLDDLLWGAPCLALDHGKKAFRATQDGRASLTESSQHDKWLTTPFR